MEDEATLLHDHSTLHGRLSLLRHRLKWKYVIPPAVFLLAVALFALLIAALNSGLKADPKPQLQLAPGNSLLGEEAPVPNGEEQIAGWTVIKIPKPGFVEAEGCENGLYAFEGFDSSVDQNSAKSLRIRNLVIDAPALSAALGQWTALESLVIENVWVNGNFSRVYLPSLKKFIYHQFRNGATDQYKQQDTLKQTLFFDKRANETWDLNRDLLNLNMSIQVTVEGTKILDVEPDSGEININTHECEQMIQNFHSEQTFPLETLSLSWCRIGAPFLQKLRENGQTIKYLFLNNAIPGSTEELAQVTESLRNLKELHIFQRFHCDWPGYQIYLNVSDLPPTLETLSVTNLDLSFVPGVGAPFLRNLSLDQYVAKDVVNNFDALFPNLQTVALFNITQNLSYPLLHRCILETVKPEQVIVTDFARHSNKTKGGRKSGNQVFGQVEELLKSAGVPTSATSFMLETAGVNGSYVGKELTSFQRNFYRFVRLAFKKIDTYTDYVIWDANPK